MGYLCKKHTTSDVQLGIGQTLQLGRIGVTPPRLLDGLFVDHLCVALGYRRTFIRTTIRAHDHAGVTHNLV